MSLTERIEQRQLHPAMLPREMRWRDVGYACFLISAAVILGAVLLHWMPTNTWVYVGLSWLYRRPVLFIFTLAALAGMAFSLVAWRERRLGVVSLATLVLAWIPWLVRKWPSIPDATIAGYLALYLGLSIGGSLWWFLVDRRRLLRRYPPHVERAWLETKDDSS